MLADLVRVTTSDNVRLDGAWYTADNVKRRFDGDAVVLLHGVAGNFYSGNLFDFLVGEFLRLGVDCLRVNTRGHDSVCVAWGKSGPSFQGAAFELVDHCRLDLRAWLDWLAGRGARRVGLLGHSLGAIKAVYAQAHEPHPAVGWVAACSAPRLSYSAFMNSDIQPRFFESVAAAREHMQQGRPDALILSKFPSPVWMTAAGFLDKYGPDERYNILRFADRVPCPLIATYGELELASGGIAFAGLADALAAVRRVDQTLDVVTVPGADHAYTGVSDRLAASLFEWLAAQFPPRQ